MRHRWLPFRVPSLGSLGLWVLLALTTLEPRAWATQDGKVTAANATIYVQVSGKMQPAQQVQSGQILRMADQEKGGWYACSIPGSHPPKAGWIRATDVAPQGRSSATIHRSDSSSGPTIPPHWSVGVVYDAALVSPSQLQAASGLAPNMSLGSSLGLELERAFWIERFLLAARVDTLLISGKLTGSSPSGGDLGYSGFALPIVLEARFDLIQASAFRLGVIAGVGVSPITTYQVTVGKTTTSASGLALFAPARVEAVIRLGSRLGILLEAGYRLATPLSTIKILNVAMGSDFSSILGGAGLRIEF